MQRYMSRLRAGETLAPCIDARAWYPTSEPLIACRISAEYQLGGLDKSLCRYQDVLGMGILESETT